MRIDEAAEPPLTDEAVGARVRIARTVRRQSQADLARGLAQHGLTLHQTAIGHVERGTRALKVTEAVVFARALDVSVDWLLGGGDPRDPGTGPAEIAAAAALDEHFRVLRAQAAQRERGAEPDARA